MFTIKRSVALIAMPIISAAFVLTESSDTAREYGFICKNDGIFITWTESPGKKTEGVIEVGNQHGLTSMHYISGTRDGNTVDFTALVGSSEIPLTVDFISQDRISIASNGISVTECESGDVDAYIDLMAARAVAGDQ